VPSPAAYDSDRCIVIATVVGTACQEVNEIVIATVVGKDCQRVNEIVVATVVARDSASKGDCTSNSCRESLSARM
jgi:hypothetical protein